jgi:RNA polymerase sigma-70 factor (ECF subfamily)
MPPTESGEDSRARRAAITARDLALVESIVDRQPQALSQLYDHYSGMLLALANRVLNDLSDSEEVLQEAFLQVWNQAARYDPKRSSVSTWLVLITRSRAIDRLRSRRVAERTVSAAEKENRRTHTSPEGLGHVFTQERRLRLRRELDNLPEPQRQVLELAFYRGMTQSEIAAETSIPLGTVKTRTLLAVKKLRKALQDELEELL